MILASSLLIWSAMIRAALIFAPPTVIALTVTPCRSSVTLDVRSVCATEEGIAKHQMGFQYAVLWILPISPPTHALEVVAPRTCPLALLLQVIATF